MLCVCVFKTNFLWVVKVHLLGSYLMGAEPPPDSLKGKTVSYLTCYLKSTSKLRSLNRCVKTVRVQRWSSGPLLVHVENAVFIPVHIEPKETNE